MVTLAVQVVGDRDIVVTSPDSGFSITYRKDGDDAPLLFAVNGISESSHAWLVKLLTSAISATGRSLALS
jgi:hypothetical protein